MDFKVFVVDAFGNMKYGFGVGSPQSVSGVQKLVQIVTNKLLKTPGLDVIDPASGGGLYSIIGNNVDISDTREIVADIAPRVKKVQDEMLLDQMNLDISPEEKVLKLNLIDISLDVSNPLQYNMTVEVINESENVAVAVIPVSALSGG